MRMTPFAALGVAAMLAPVALLIPAASWAQSPAAQAGPAVQPQAVRPLEVGAVAPDFSLPGSTRFGLLREPVRLSDFRGKTVVLAFFFQARTPG